MERQKVGQALEESSPKVIALSISPEELDGLEKFRGGNVPAANFEEDVYMERLSEFGEVSKPPPCFLEARDQAKVRNLKLEPLDLNNEDFTEAYVTHVTTIEMMFQGRVERKLRGPHLQARTAEEFVLKFDKTINSKLGYRRLERARETHMAKRLAKLMDESATTLALVELERAEGVRQLLAQLPAAVL